MIAAYTRVSTEAQTQGNGLAQQRKEIVTYAAMQEIAIDEWFSDAVTGETEDRAQLNRLKDLAQDGVLKTLILDRMDRLGRTTEINLSLLRQFQEWGVKVVLVQQAFDELAPSLKKFMLTIMAALAEMQKANLLQHMSSCKRQAVANGQFAGGAVPMGYKLSSTPGQLAVDPPRAATVQRVFELLDRGGSYSAVAAQLNAEGAVTTKGCKFYPATVRNLAMNRDFYKGHATLHRSDVQNVRPVHTPLL